MKMAVAVCDKHWMRAQVYPATSHNEGKIKIGDTVECSHLNCSKVKKNRWHKRIKKNGRK